MRSPAWPVLPRCGSVGFSMTSIRNTIELPSKSRPPKKKGRLTVQMDEMWSFLGSKNCPVWLWQAIDQDTCIDCRSPCWRWYPSRSKGTVGVATRGVSTVCSLLQGFLGSVQTGVAREAASSVGKRERKKKRHREGHGWRSNSPP